MPNDSIDWQRAIPLFVGDRERLFSDKKLRLVTFPDLVFGLAYMGGGHLFLGAAIMGWHDGYLCRPCPKCESKAWVTWAGGSPLSGAGAWSGYCPRCGYVHVRERVTQLVDQPKVRGYWASLGYQPVLQKASPWIFSFVDGAVQQGNLQEIRLPVPGWEEFIRDYDASLLVRADEILPQEDRSTSFGLTIRGKTITLGTEAHDE